MQDYGLYQRKHQPLVLRFVVELIGVVVKVKIRMIIKRRVIFR